MTLRGSPQTFPVSGRVERRYSSRGEGALGEKGTKDSDKLWYSSCFPVTAGIPKEPSAQGTTGQALSALGCSMRCGHSLDWMLLEGFSNINASVIL